MALEPDRGAATASSARTALAGARRYGWWPIVVLGFAVALEAGEVQSLSTAADQIRSHFHISHAELGAIPTIMSGVGIFWGFLVGWFADRVNRIRLMTFLLAAFTLLMGLQALVASFAALVALRVALSWTESTDPMTTSLIGDYYPVEERARRLSIYDIISGVVGGILPLAITGILVDSFGWRAAFLVWVPFGIVATLLLRRLREPDRGAQDAAFEQRLHELATEDAAAEGERERTPHELVSELVQGFESGEHSLDVDYATASVREAAKGIWRARSWCLFVVAFTLAQTLQNALAFWGVSYFKHTFHLSAAKASAVAGVLGLGSVVGLFLGGYIADRLLRRGIVNARVWVSGIALITAGLAFIPALSTSSLPVAIPLFLIAGFFFTLPQAPSDAVLTDAMLPELRGRAAAVKNAVEALANTGPLIAGAIADAASLRVAFLVLIPLYIIGGLVALVGLRHYPTDLAYVVAHARAKRLVNDT